MNENAWRPQAHKYIADIDGLRAIAVLAVVLFHLRVPGFAGGYVGVDIFFVISGFLITGIIRDAVRDGSFTFRGFYLRRLRRLLPAILATVLVTTAAVLLLLLPEQIESFARSGIASLFSFSNIVFFSEAGYWDTDSNLKPLLHTWSLGVEEQFYLFWPALIVLMMRARQEQVFVLGLGALFLASFVACVAVTPINQAATFYLLPFRVWQFCLGALSLEFCRGFAIDERSRLFYRGIGLILCGVSIVCQQDPATFPGWQAMAPSFGASLILLASSADRPSPFLSNAATNWVGRISYSLYLVHWPPIAIYRAATGRELDISTQIAFGALIIVLAVALHYGVERRFYRRDRHASERSAPVFAGIAGSCVVIAGVLGAAWLMPTSMARRHVRLSAETVAEYRKGRWVEMRAACQLVELGKSKRCGPAKDRPILIIGNSKEVDALNFLGVALPEEWRARRVLFGEINSCRGKYKVVGDWIVSSDPACQHRFDVLKQSLETVNWAAIVYAAHEPFKTSKEKLVTTLETIRKRRPDIPIITWGDYIGTSRFCSELINQYGSSDACKMAENVYYFENGAEKKGSIYTRVMAVSDFYIDQVGILCAERKLENCLTETPDGDPAFVDKTHFTYPFVQLAANKYLAENPGWFESVLASRRGGKTGGAKSN